MLRDKGNCSPKNLECTSLGKTALMRECLMIFFKKALLLFLQDSQQWIKLSVRTPATLSRIYFHVLCQRLKQPYLHRYPSPVSTFPDPYPVRKLSTPDEERQRAVAIRFALGVQFCSSRCMLNCLRLNTRNQTANWMQMWGISLIWDLNCNTLPPFRQDVTFFLSQSNSATTRARGEFPSANIRST